MCNIMNNFYCIWSKSIKIQTARIPVCLSQAACGKVLRCEEIFEGGGGRMNVQLDWYMACLGADLIRRPLDNAGAKPSGGTR